MDKGIIKKTKTTTKLQCNNIMQNQTRSSYWVIITRRGEVGYTTKCFWNTTAVCSFYCMEDAKC